MSVESIKAAVRDIPGFPKPGIIFKDIAPILGDAALFRETVDILADQVRKRGADKIAAIDARGFIFGAAAAFSLGIGLIPVRKKGKLPYRTIEESYDLEYGSSTLTIHEDAVRPGERVVVMDDLLATGGTAAATVRLVERAGGVVAGVVFLIELSFLQGRAKLQGRDVYAAISF